MDNKLRVFLGKRRIIIAAKLELFYANKNWHTVSRYVTISLNFNRIDKYVLLIRHCISSYNLEIIL